MRLAVNASVAIKWIIRDPHTEPDADKAVAILRAIRGHSVEALAPPHWTAEVLAVITRARPQRIPITFGILGSFPFEEVSGEVIYRRAASLSIDLNHHLFDTLNHAVALERDATLVTADERYFDKAAGLGSVMMLADWEG